MSVTGLGVQAHESLLFPINKNYIRAAANTLIDNHGFCSLQMEAVQRVERRQSTLAVSGTNRLNSQLRDCRLQVWLEMAFSPLSLERGHLIWIWEDMENSDRQLGISVSSRESIQDKQRGRAEKGWLRITETSTLEVLVCFPLL